MMDFPCPICPAMHKTFKRLKKHMAKRHSEHELFECQFCDLITLNKKTLAKHKESAHRLEKYSCNKCKYSSTNWTKIQKHYSNVHTDIDAVEIQTENCEKEQEHEIFQCLFCDMISTERNILLQHKVSEHLEENFICNQCDFSSQKWNRMKKHFLRLHSKVKTLSQIPMRKLILNDKQKQSIYKCSCGMMALNKTIYIQHKEKIHPLEKFKCDLCEFSTKKWQKLCQHMSSLHSKTSSCTLKIATPLSECNVEVASDNKVFQENISTPRKRKLELDNNATYRSIKRLKVSELPDNNNIKETTADNVTNSANIIMKSGLPPSEGANDVAKTETQIYDSDTCPSSTHKKRSLLMHKNSHLSSGSKSKNSQDLMKASSKSFKVPMMLDSNINVLTLIKKTGNENTVKSELLFTETAKTMPKTETEIYNSEICGFSTPEKTSLLAHQNLHFSLRSKGQNSQDNSSKSISNNVPVSSNINMIANSELSSTEGKRNVTKKKTQIYNCEICSFTTQDKSSMLAHKNAHHSSGSKGQNSQDSVTGLFFCHKCDRVFDDEMGLNFHQNNHDKLRPFECGICHTHFCTNWNLKLHLRKHENERPYVCHMCEYSTMQLITLREHLLIHDQQKTFMCKECGYTGRVKAHLAVHMRKHTQERPFGCDQCGRRFNQRAHLKNHKARKHAHL